MRITIVGSGNVATVLGRKMNEGGHIIHQVYSRNAEHAALLAGELSAAAVSEWKEIDEHADLYIIALSDQALQQLPEQLQIENKLVVHTAGSVPMDILKTVSNNYGILYPLQSLRKELPPPVIPILVDANNPWNKTKLYAFAQSFADSVSYADDMQRSKLHLAAVITNNFSNHLFALAEEFCSREGVDFKTIVPLLEETVRRLDHASPADVQTGPAIRNDHTTMQKHLEMLKEYPQLKRLYEVMSESIGGR